MTGGKESSTHGLEGGKNACCHSGSQSGRKDSREKSKPQVCASCGFKAQPDTLDMLQESEMQNLFSITSRAAAEKKVQKCFF